jgi:hypothetical protein
MHDIGQDRPEALAFAALDLIEADVPRLAFYAGAILLRQEGFLRATRFSPADAMPHGGVTGGHRLTVHADLLSQASGDARFGVGELDALGADPAGPTREAALRIDERDMMRRPRQVVPRTIAARSHAVRASTTATAGVPTHATTFNPNRQPAALRLVHRHHPKPRQAQNPRTIATRSHRSSLVGCTSRENTIQFRMATWDRSFVV